MKKFYQLLIWLLASFCAIPVHAEQELDLHDPFGFRFFILPDEYKTPALNAAESEKLKWVFLEDLLVAQPDRTTKALNQQQGGSSSLLLASLGAAYLTYRMSQKIDAYFGLDSKIFKAISVLLGCKAFIACASLQQITPHHMRKIQINNIMKLWPHIRDRIPEEVWPLLESLYAVWLKNDARRYTGMIDKTLKSIDAAIKTHANSTDVSELIKTLGGQTS